MRQTWRDRQGQVDTDGKRTEKGSGRQRERERVREDRQTDRQTNRRLS